MRLKIRIADTTNFGSGYAGLGITGILLLAGLLDNNADMVYRWDTQEEYGCGYLIAAISAFFVWQRKNELLEQEFVPSWLGIFVVLIAGLFFCLGAVATTHILSQFAMVLAVLGVALSVMSIRRTKAFFPEVHGYSAFRIHFSHFLPDYGE